MDKVQHYEAKLGEQLQKVPILRKLEKTVGVPKTYLFLGTSSVVFLALIFNLGGSLISDIIGWAFPAYFSLRALDKNITNEYSQWISYWCIFGLINMIEFFSPLLSYLIPFYFLIKTTVLLWLFLPNYHGAEYTYRAFLRPVYLKLNAIVNDVDGACEMPSMKEATDSLRASATAAAAKIEKTVSEAKTEVSQEVSSALESGAKPAAEPLAAAAAPAEAKPAPLEASSGTQHPEEKKDI